jgi:hypothetical protein
MEIPSSFMIEVNISKSHALESLSYSTSTKMETHLHTDPQEIQVILKGYETDPHFKSVTEAFPLELPYIFKNYHHNSCFGTELCDRTNILLPLCTLTPTLFMCSGRIGLAMELYLMYDLELSLRTLPLFPLWYIKVGL